MIKKIVIIFVILMGLIFWQFSNKKRTLSENMNDNVRESSIQIDEKLQNHKELKGETQTDLNLTELLLEFRDRQRAHDACAKEIESYKLDNLIKNNGNPKDEQFLKEIFKKLVSSKFYVEESFSLKKKIDQVAHDKILLDALVEKFYAFEECDPFVQFKVPTTINLKSYDYDLQRKLYGILLDRHEYIQSLKSLKVSLEVFKIYNEAKILQTDISGEFNIMHTEFQEKLTTGLCEKGLDSFSCLRLKSNFIDRFKALSFKILSSQDW